MAAPIGRLLRLVADAHCLKVTDGVQAGTCTPAWPPPARPLAPAAASGRRTAPIRKIVTPMGRWAPVTRIWVWEE